MYVRLMEVRSVGAVPNELWKRVRLLCLQLIWLTATVVLLCCHNAGPIYLSAHLEHPSSEEPAADALSLVAKWLDGLGALASMQTALFRVEPS